MGETVATLLSLVSLTRETLDSALLLKVLLGEISFSSLKHSFFLHLQTRQMEPIRIRMTIRRPAAAMAEVTGTGALMVRCTGALSDPCMLVTDTW